MSFLTYISAPIVWFLQFCLRLISTLLWLVFLPFQLLYFLIFYIFTNGWSLALLIIALTGIIMISLKYSKRKRDSNNNVKSYQSQLSVIVEEIFRTLPVQSSNGWMIEGVCQGLRIFTRFFPALAHTSRPPSVLAVSTVLDAKNKNAFKCIHDPSELQSWFGPVKGTVQVTSRGQTTPPPSLQSDTITMTLKRHSPRYKAWAWLIGLWQLFLQLINKRLPSSHNEYYNENLTRTWFSNEEISYMFISSAPQATPTSLPFNWSLFVIAPLPQQKQYSVLTILALPSSQSHMTSAMSFVANQIASFRDHILMKECNVLSINYNRRVGGVNTRDHTHIIPDTPISPITTQTTNSTQNGHVQNGSGQISGRGSDLSGRGSVATGNSAISGGDIRYVNMAVKVAHDLVKSADAGIEEGWTLVANNSKGIKIMKKTPGRGDPPINSVKGTTNINCPPEFLLRVLMDPSHSKELDDLLDTMTLVKEIQPHVHLMHLKYKSVWPTSARDFCVLNSFGQLDKHTFVHAAASVVDDRIPENKNYVRAEVLSGGYVIRDVPGQQGVSKVTYVTQVDLKGNVPTFLVNKVTESQPQCVGHFRALAEKEFSRLNRNLIKMKQFEEQFVVPRIVATPTATPTSSLTPSQNISLESTQNEIPILPSPPSSTHIRATPTLSETSLGETTPPNELEETFTADEESDKEQNKERDDDSIEVSLSATDTFNRDRVPSLPISNVLDRLPRYRSDSTESDESNVPAITSSMSSILIDYPRTEEGIDYRTMGNQNAARLLEEMFHISELDLMNSETFKDQSNGWKFQGIEKDVVILKKKKFHDCPFHSFIGKGLIDLSPQEVYNCVRNPNQRYVFDNMLKELHVVKQIESDLYILHMQHETTQCFLKQSRDFCILVCERSEPNKKIIVGASIEVPECPPQLNCTRGKVITSGWVIEPYRYREKLLTQVTYLVQVDMGGVPAALVNFVSRRQPLAVAYLRDYLETTSLNSNRHGRENRSSLLSGDPSSDFTMMIKSYM